MNISSKWHFQHLLFNICDIAIWTKDYNLNVVKIHRPIHQTNAALWQHWWHQTTTNKQQKQSIEIIVFVTSNEYPMSNTAQYTFSQAFIMRSPFYPRPRKLPSLDILPLRRWRLYHKRHQKLSMSIKFCLFILSRFSPYVFNCSMSAAC